MIHRGDSVIIFVTAVFVGSILIVVLIVIIVVIIVIIIVVILLIIVGIIHCSGFGLGIKCGGLRS